MLNHLLGTVFSLQENSLVVDVNGVGISVFITRKVREDIENNGKEKVFLYSRLIGRDGDYVVYGFYNEQERLLFDHLRQIQGVGAKTSILILSRLSGRDVYEAVCREQASTFSSIKGIGKKVAARIVLELKNKVETIWIHDYYDSDEERYQVGNSLIDQAVQALVHLGFKRGKAQLTVQKALASRESTIGLEDLIKECLKAYNE